jgi:hypothetical protein
MEIHHANEFHLLNYHGVLVSIHENIFVAAQLRGWADPLPYHDRDQQHRDFKIDCRATYGNLDFLVVQSAADGA